MSDREKSTRPDPFPEPPEIADPPPVPDPEADHPIREVFARYLDPADVTEFVASMRERYTRRLETDGLRIPEGLSLTGARLAAVAVDLRRTAEVLAAAETEHVTDALETPDVLLSVGAGPRRLEVLAVAERIDRMIAWKFTSERLLPPGLEVAGMVPEVTP